ncbi:MAG: hypothetical protein QM503_01990 [Bacteroidota bacterium]
MKEFKNILLVSGSGRNIGKTTFACNIINQIKEKGYVIGLKITPHFHTTGSNQKLIEEGDGYKIYMETDIESDKDSSRMLRAGADKVYYVISDDLNLDRISDHLGRLLPANCAVVCESGSFANVFKPGLHILIVGVNTDDSKKSYISNIEKSDVVINSDVVFNSNITSDFEFTGNHWLRLT